MKKIVGKKIKIHQPKNMTITKASPNPINQLTGIQAKFKELKAVRAKLSGMHDLYVKHDQLMKELMPLFITTEADKFTIAREITIGSTKYRYNPSFWDEAKAELKAKRWKSAAFPSGTIE